MAYVPAALEGKSHSQAEALGQSEAFLAFQEQISAVAPIDRPVLILGERGTGKELAASRIHFLSGRWQKPLVTLNCAALTPTLIGSELFGYEKGAFTGAGTRQAGRFEHAADGTLFLDEIGNIPMEVQEKILRVVEYGSFERVGLPGRCRWMSGWWPPPMWICLPWPGPGGLSRTFWTVSPLRSSMCPP